MSETVPNGALSTPDQEEPVNMENADSATEPNEAKSICVQKELLDEEEEDVPADFFDDFSNKDFLAGLDVVDTWEEANAKISLAETEKNEFSLEEPNPKQVEDKTLDTSERKDSRHNRSRVSARDRPGRNEDRRNNSPSRDKIKGRNEDRKNNSPSRNKADPKKSTEELRRDPNKTKRDIQRDKKKCEKDKEAKIISEKLRVVETGLVPPGMEMEVDFDLEPLKEIVANKSKSSERHSKGSKRVTSRSPSGSRNRRRYRNESPVRRRISPVRRRLSRDRRRISQDRRNISPIRRSPRYKRLSPTYRRSSPRTSPSFRRSSPRFKRASPTFRRSPVDNSTVYGREPNFTRSSLSIGRSPSFGKISPTFNKTSYERPPVQSLPRYRARRDSRSPVYVRDRVSERNTHVDEVKSRRSWKSPSPDRKRRKEKSLSHRESSPRYQSFLEEIDAKLTRQTEEDRLRDIRQKLNGVPCVADILTKYAPVPSPVPTSAPYAQPHYNPQFFIGSTTSTFAPMPVPPPSEYNINPYAVPQQHPVINQPYFNPFLNREKNDTIDVSCPPPFVGMQTQKPYSNNIPAPMSDCKNVSIKNKIKVITSCQDAIKYMSEFAKPSGRFCYKKTENTSDMPACSPFQSPMKKVPRIRLQFTTEKREWLEVNVSPVTQLLQKLGIKKPDVKLISNASASVSASSVDLYGQSKTLVKMSQTDPMKCAECEARKQIEYASTSVQCDTTTTADFGCQVSEDDFLSTARSALKEMLKSQSLSSLTPAQLLAHEKGSASEGMEVFPAARKLIDASPDKKSSRAGLSNNDSYPYRSVESTFERRPQPEFSRNFNSSYAHMQYESTFEPPARSQTYSSSQFIEPPSRSMNSSSNYNPLQPGAQNNFRGSNNYPQIANARPPMNQGGPNVNYGGQNMNMGQNNMRPQNPQFNNRAFEPPQQSFMSRRF